MRREHELRREPITDEEVACAIRYLDPDHPIAEMDRDPPNSVFVIWVSVLVLLTGALAYIWLWWRMS